MSKITVGKWIPCKDNLPDESDYYFATVKNAFDEYEVCVIWFANKDDYGGESEWREITDEDTVIAWMKLPDAYKENE